MSMHINYSWILMFLLILAGPARGQWAPAISQSSLSVGCFAGNGNVMFAGTYSGGLHRSLNYGDIWTPISFFTGMSVHAVAMSGDRVFAGTSQGAYISTNGGSTWTPAGITNALALHVVGDTIFTAGPGVYFTVDGGAHWIPIGDSLTALPRTLAKVGPTLFVGTSSDGVFATSDMGVTWSAMNTNLNNLHINALHSMGGNLFAGTVGGVYRMPLTGDVWEYASTGIGAASVSGLASAGNELFASTIASGVLVSTDHGDVWTQVNTGLPAMSVLSLAFHNNRAFAGPHGHSIWVRPLSQITNVEGYENVPGELKLYDNFPNPFNPTTIIRFSLPYTERVVATVFDVVGRKVTTLLDEERTAGMHSILFAADNLATGVYTIQLHAGKWSASKQLMILK